MNGNVDCVNSWECSQGPLSHGTEPVLRREVGVGQRPVVNSFYSNVQDESLRSSRVFYLNFAFQVVRMICSLRSQ